MDRQQHQEHDLRRHGAGGDAGATAERHSPDERPDLQSGGAPGSADWRVLYVSTGDGGTGERNDVRRLNPQRLDHFSGTIIRIVPDLREHVSTSQVSENGQYRIPNDNPFVSTPGARKEIFAHGMRNPHRMAWDVGAGPGVKRTCWRS